MVMISVNYMTYIRFSAPISSLLTERFGFRPVVIAGGLIACAGLLASAFVNSIYTLFFTYSIITCR
jgi:MFS family permease